MKGIRSSTTEIVAFAMLVAVLCTARCTIGFELRKLGGNRDVIQRHSIESTSVARPHSFAKSVLGRISKEELNDKCLEASHMVDQLDHSLIRALNISSGNPRFISAEFMVNGTSCWINAEYFSCGNRLELTKPLHYVPTQSETSILRDQVAFCLGNGVYGYDFREATNYVILTLFAAKEGSVEGIFLQPLCEDRYMREYEELSALGTTQRGDIIWKVDTGIYVSTNRR